MKFGLAKEHLDFFYKHHYIEFENLLSKKDAAILKQEVTNTLAKRLNTQEEKLKHHSLESLYLSGFDTWRDSTAIKRILFRSYLAEVAANLVKKKPLRIGFDQVFYSPSTEYSMLDIPPCLEKPTSLSFSSCLQGVACGLLLHLTTSLSEERSSVFKKDLQPVLPIPKKEGSGIFFSPDMPFSIESLTTTPKNIHVLIAYSLETTVYRHCDNHLHTHAYKKIGYVFGDRLKNSTHPLLYKG